MQLWRRPAPARVGNPNTLRGASNGLRASMTAAGMRVGRMNSGIVQRVQMPWQSRSFAYYDLLGEIKYAASFYSRGLSQLTLYSGYLDDDGHIIKSTNQEAIDILNRIQDPGGGRHALLSSYGRLMFLTGECYLFVSNDPQTDLEQWEILSTDELRPNGSTYQRFRAPSLQAESYVSTGEGLAGEWTNVEGDNAVAYRLWKKHPRYSMWADATMQGVLDLCEELVLLTQAVRARTRSRLAGSGILLIDERMSPAAAETIGDEDPHEDILLADLTEAMTAPIADEGAASAIVPLTVRVPVPDGMKVSDMLYHLQIIDPMQLYPETGLRYECIKRIAIGLDMPPEILMGLQDSNHWTAWQIDESTWKGHLQPIAQQFVDDLNQTYYRPTLRALGVPDWDRQVIAFDATAIINHPDRTRDARDLYDRRAIGKAALRDAAGFNDETAPTKEELAEMIGISVRDGSLAMTGEPRASDSTGGSSGRGVPEPAAPGGGAEGENLPPEQPADAPQPAVTGSVETAMTVARILGAADLAVLRARESAGNRVRNLAKRNQEATAKIDGVRASEVIAILGPETMAVLKAGSERNLVTGCHDLIVDTLRLWGIVDKDLVAFMVEQVEAHAARTLYHQHATPLPQSVRNYIEGFASGATFKRGS